LVFGNRRPALLAATERELWRLLLRIASGSEALQELVGFLEKFEVLENEHAQQDSELDWFSAESAYYSINIHNSSNQKPLQGCITVSRK
jgi:hypothetical protein